MIKLPKVPRLGLLRTGEWPALIYLSLNYNSPGSVAGWAIPSATDIAFALCILTLAGKGIAPSIKIFLLAIAIFDDLGAILVIAAFYSSGLAVLPLLLAAFGMAILFVLNRRNHSSSRRHQGEQYLVAPRKKSFPHFPLQLKANDEEEKNHQDIFDPSFERLRRC